MTTVEAAVAPETTKVERIKSEVYFVVHVGGRCGVSLILTTIPSFI